LPAFVRREAAGLHFAAAQALRDTAATIGQTLSPSLAEQLLQLVYQITLR